MMWIERSGLFEKVVRYDIGIISDCIWIGILF